MSENTSAWGGKRSGSGRKALGSTKRVTVCLTDSLYPEFKRRGGAAWLRSELQSSLRPLPNSRAHARPQSRQSSFAPSFLNIRPIEDDRLEAGEEEIFFPAPQPSSLKIPVFENSVQAGFPSPAESYIDRSLDLNDFLIPNPAATFFVYVSGDSMNLAGMDEGDLLIVDRSREPKNGDIVIMSVNDEFTVKRLEKTPAGLRLLPESSNPLYKPILPRENDEWRLIGVVTHTIKAN